jgi:chromosome partitioning protein
MIVLFANQKGGVGKSTLALLFANYISLTQNKGVIVFDMDNQRSIYNKAQAAKVLENEPLYEVEVAELEQFKIIFDLVRGKENLITIIDIAGTIENNDLIPIFKCADLVICPFAYDEFSVSSTIEFSYILKRLKESVNIVFVPNRVKANVKYETLESVHKALSDFGEITRPVAERIDFQRISTYETSHTIIQVVEPVFQLIYHQFLRNKIETI